MYADDPVNVNEVHERLTLQLSFLHSFREIEVSEFFDNEDFFVRC